MKDNVKKRAAMRNVFNQAWDHYLAHGGHFWELASMFATKTKILLEEEDIAQIVEKLEGMKVAYESEFK